MNEKTKYRAMLGWQIGILIGLLAATVASAIYAEPLWLKIFSVIGLLSASIGTFYGLYVAWNQYKFFLDQEKIKKELLSSLAKSEEVSGDALLPKENIPINNNGETK